MEYEKQNVQTSNEHRIMALEEQLIEKDVLVEQLLDQIDQMKISFQAWVEREDSGSCAISNLKMDTVCVPENEAEPAHSRQEGEQSRVAEIPIRDDDSYFMSYANFDIHYDMLSVSVD